MFAALAAMVLAPSPVFAKWKLIEQGQPVKVAKSAMQVTPEEDWNRWTRRPIKPSEVWTLDGANLNELYFVSGLAPGMTLYKDTRKKEQPLPALRSGLQLTDIPDFVESSMRLALNTSVFELTNVEPASVGGHPGVRFTYEYAVASSPLVRKGLAVGTLTEGNLHLITFTAPAIYYYDRDLPKAEAIMASVQF